MKKKVVISVIAAIAVIGIIIAACLLKYFNVSLYIQKAPKPVKNAIEYSSEYKKLSDGKLSNYTELAKGEYIDVDFGGAVKFDTVSLYENGDNCKEFKIYIDNNGEWEMVYQHDRILPYHLCFVGEVEASKLRIEITDCIEPVKISEMQVYMAEKREEPVVVSQYLLITSREFEELIGDEGFSGYYDVVTDPILHGEVYLDENANVCFNTSEENFAKQLSALKTIIGDREVRLWCDVRIDQKNAEGQGDYDATTDFINNNIDEITANLKAFVEKYDLYGIDYDWEYPTEGKHWKAYDKIVIETAKVTKVSVALPPWGIRFSKQAREAIELVNVMAYDLFDARGDHSNIYIAGYDSIAKVEAAGFSREQILLGVPTYGRTADKSGDAWPVTAVDGIKLGKWGNIVKDYPYTDSATGEQKTCDAYVDSYAEARDKTATAVDMGAGGIMIFRAFCDAPYTEEYSLTKAIGEAIDEREAK